MMRDAEELLKATVGDPREKLKAVRGRLSAALESSRATFGRLQDGTIEPAKATDHVIRGHPAVN